jgi:uncharacterized protein YutE (UPF0331/DUF86 family)
MVDPEILEARTLHVLHHIARLRAQAETTADTFASDETLWNATLMDLQQAIQGCIDLAMHVCVDDKLGSPGTAAEAFGLLHRDGRVSADLSDRLARSAGLRNLIVHQYGQLDREIIVSVIRNDLTDLEDFLRALAPG